MSCKKIFLIISFFFALILTPQVFALNGNFDSVIMCSTNLGCNTSTTLPYSYSYSDSVRINFSSLNLVQGKTYNIHFYMNITSPAFTFNTGYPQLFVLDSNNNATRAYPDRGESLLVNNTGGNTYSVNWTFELDNTGGNYVGAYVIFTFSANYNGNTISTYINSSNFLYFDSDDPSGNQDIINNQNNNTQNIINNNNDNTTTIINNNNDNTDKIIESNQVCDNYNVLRNASTKSEDVKGYLNNNGSVSTNNDLYTTSKYYVVNNGKTYTITRDYSTNVRYCLYNSDKTLNACYTANNQQVSTITPSFDGFLRFTYNVTNNYSTVLTGEYCTNGNQAVNDSINDLNNTLNDDSEPDTNGFLQTLSNLISPQTPVSDLLTLPLRLLNKYIDTLNNTCSPFDLGNLYGTNIIFPCINVESYLGSYLWSLIDSLFSIFMIYNIAMLCVSIYESITNLEDTLGSLYTPKHAYEGYQPKHGG